MFYIKIHIIEFLPIELQVEAGGDQEIQVLVLLVETLLSRRSSIGRGSLIHY